MIRHQTTQSKKYTKKWILIQQYIARYKKSICNSKQKYYKEVVPVEYFFKKNIYIYTGI